MIPGTTKLSSHPGIDELYMTVNVHLLELLADVTLWCMTAPQRFCLHGCGITLGLHQLEGNTSDAEMLANNSDVQLLGRWSRPSLSFTTACAIQP